MKPLHFAFVALASVLFGSAVLSCNNDETPTGPADEHSAQDRPSASTMPGAERGTMDQLRAGCPMVVRGADVTATDTEGGVSLTFTTATGDVSDLRRRVQHMAQMYEMHQGQAGMVWQHMGGEGMGHAGPGMGGEGTRHMAGRGPMPAASTKMTDTDLGARLELRPSDASQLGALRDHIRWHQQKLHSGECWMLQDRATATPRGEQE